MARCTGMIVDNVLGQRAAVICRVGSHLTTEVDGGIEAGVVIFHGDSLLLCAVVSEI